jgi:NAD(P)-dependent dehydrogenase (short-subunit alcohol dehydrogenase family)
MTGRIALVTGGGSGIGREAALALQGAGWHVTIAGRRAEQLDNTARMAKPGGGRVLCVPTDVARPDEIAALFDEAKATFGRLDLLFNNAGIGAPGAAEDLDIDKWKQVVDVNLTGCFICAQHAIRIMREQQPKGGRIINNGSISAHAPRPNSIAYVATKHAITGLTKSLNLDGRQHDITCGQIDIGNAETPLAARMANGVPQADGSIRAEPLMDVDHVGQAILHMANLPLESNVLFMTIMATKMPFVGRG